MNPEEYGWRLVKEKYNPVQGYIKPCHKEIASQLCCSCRKDCSSQLCSCRKSGVDCTNACRCSEDCVNARSHNEHERSNEGDTDDETE